MDDFITKPVEIGELRAALERWGAIIHPEALPPCH